MMETKLDEAKRREEMAVQFTAALLSNPHFSQAMMKSLNSINSKGFISKDDKFFRLMAAYGCEIADHQIARLDKK